ncbi:MAG: response regulator [Planctomycetes bacterium]|nr:response regulator [Planctomycetota bacterium]
MAPLRRAISYIFRKNQFEVLEAENGEEALSLLSEIEATGGVIDLIITDIQMPKMNGLDLMDKLIAAKSRIPVMAITGYGNKKLLVELLRRGCCEYIDKPFEELDLLERVRELLKRNQNQAGAPLPSAPPVEAAENKKTTTENTSSLPEASIASVDKNEGHVVIHPTCDLVNGASEKFISLVMNSLNEDTRSLCFDLSAVKDMDDLGVGVFIVVARMASRTNTPMKLSLQGLQLELQPLFRSFRLLEHYKV